jgi:hypothetical protein
MTPTIFASPDFERTDEHRVDGLFVISPALRVSEVAEKLDNVSSHCGSWD